MRIRYSNRMNGKVLYIEDESFFGSIISKKLDENEYVVDVAPTGAEGVKLAKENEYDLILLDLILPEMSGFEVLQELKVDPQTARVPVVILSNLSSDADKTKAKELGAHSFYVKINAMPSEILALVKRICGEKNKTGK